MPRHAVGKPLSSEEKRALAIAIQEAKVRGLSISNEVLDALNHKELEWPIDGNGYFVRNDGHLFNPTDEQKRFVSSQARFVGFVGARGSGKTASGAQKALRKIMSGEDGAILNPDFENLKYSTWPEFKNWIPWNMVVPSQRHRQYPDWEPHQPFTMVFMNGVRVNIKGLKNPDSARGPNINWLWYDEATRDITGLAWKIAIASVRIGLHPQSWATFTPRDLKQWVYSFFIEKDVPKEALEVFEKLEKGDRILVETFHGTIDDNKENLDPGFYASILSSYTGWLRTREVEGEFANEGGKLGDRNWFRDRVLDSPPPNISKKARFWDLAATEKKMAKDDPDETVGSLVDKFYLDENEDAFKKLLEKLDHDPNFCLEDQVGGYWAWDKIKESIANVARFDGPYIPVYIEQEPGSGGKNQIAEIQSYFKSIPELASHTVKGIEAKKIGDRVLAANPWLAKAAQGKVWIVKGAWNRAFLDQVDGFTQIEHDDHVTSVTGGIYVLNPFKSWKRVPFLHV